MAEDKREARARLKDAAGTMSAEDRERADRKITYTLLSWPEFGMAKSLFCFVSMAGEPDTRAFLRSALAMGKRVLVPRCKAGGLMDLCEIRSLEELAPVPPFGLLEPAGDVPAQDIADVDIALIPCLAATREGQRLGHGGGYYDRYMEAARAMGAKTRFALLAYEAQVEEELPLEEHDQSADLLITEAGVWEKGQSQR